MGAMRVAIPIFLGYNISSASVFLGGGNGNSNLTRVGKDIN